MSAYVCVCVHDSPGGLYRQGLGILVTYLALNAAADIRVLFVAREYRVRGIKCALWRIITSGFNLSHIWRREHTITKNSSILMLANDD